MLDPALSSIDYWMTEHSEGEESIMEFARAIGQQCYEAGVRAERERAAQIVLSTANCGCNGKHGYCTVDDPAKALAERIRKGE